MDIDFGKEAALAVGVAAEAHMLMRARLDRGGPLVLVGARHYNVCLRLASRLIVARSKSAADICEQADKFAHALKTLAMIQWEEQQEADAMEEQTND